MTESRSFRLLTHQVAISGPAPEVALAFAFLGNSAEQEVPLRYRLSYRISRAGGGYELTEGDDRFAVAETTDVLLALLRRRLRLRVFDYLARAGWLIIDAAIVTAAGRRLLLTSDGDRVARAALTARLLALGRYVEGGHSVAIRAGSALAIPLPLVLEPAAASSVYLGGLLARLPCSHLKDQACGPGCARAVDPSALQAGLRLAPGPVHAVLAVGHGAVAGPLDPPQAVRALLGAQRKPFVAQPGEAVRQAASLLNSGRGGDIGQLPDWTAEIRRAVLANLLMPVSGSS
jgi:hypothetical protein